MRRGRGRRAAARRPSTDPGDRGGARTPAGSQGAASRSSCSLRPGVSPIAARRVDAASCARPPASRAGSAPCRSLTSATSCRKRARAVARPGRRREQPFESAERPAYALTRRSRRRGRGRRSRTRLSPRSGRPHHVPVALEALEHRADAAPRETDELASRPASSRRARRGAAGPASPRRSRRARGSGALRWRCAARSRRIIDRITASGRRCSSPLRQGAHQPST